MMKAYFRWKATQLIRWLLRPLTGQLLLILLLCLRYMLMRCLNINSTAMVFGITVPGFPLKRGWI